MSDAIRLFLLQVVRSGGLPFSVRDPSVRGISGKQLLAMKRAEQAQDRKLAAAEEVPREASIMLRPERLKGADIEWPEDSAQDE